MRATKQMAGISKPQQKDGEKYGGGVPSPTLYVVGTPIGNLQDMTFRAVETLKRCTLVLAEDTRQTKKLLSHFDIQAKTQSCHKFNENALKERMTELFAEHKAIALVSDAGTPTVSDPGAPIVAAAREHGATICPIPGVSAVTAGLSAAGVPFDAFTFVGFLPKKKKERESLYEQFAATPHPAVFFLSPHHAEGVLKEFAEAFAGRALCICRELTKIHEECLTTVLPDLPEVTTKGEFTCILGPGEVTLDAPTLELCHLSTRDHLLTLVLFRGRGKKEAIAEVARVRGLPRNEIYRIGLSLPM